MLMRLGERSALFIRSRALLAVVRGRILAEMRRARRRLAGPRRGPPLAAGPAYQAGTASGLLAAFAGPGSVANPAGDAAAMLRHMQAAAEDFERAVALAPDL